MRCEYIRYIDHKGNEDRCEDDGWAHWDSKFYCISHLREVSKDFDPFALEAYCDEYD